MNVETGISGIERRERLLRFVESRERVSIEQICSTFSVSPATARRDLQMLVEDGKVRRVHGGALAVRNAPPEPPVAQRSAAQADEKRRIGRAAAGLVEDGETVFLSSGTTVLEAAKNLRDHRNLTVVTNSLLVMNVLADVPTLTLIALGGLLRASELSFLGHLAEQALDELRVSKVLLGIRAVDVKAGLTNDYLPETQTDRKILSIGRQTILLADDTKCRRVATFFVAPATAIDTLVTNSEAPPDFRESMRALGIRVITA